MASAGTARPARPRGRPSPRSSGRSHRSGEARTPWRLREVVALAAARASPVTLEASDRLTASQTEKTPLPTFFCESGGSAKAGQLRQFI
jgi:hypothetical protein